MKTDYFPFQLPHFRPARAHSPSPPLFLFFLARDRAHAHPAIFGFYLHLFTYPPQNAVSLHIIG